ncbi:HAD hydrolase-like protein [Alicyclobacillus tolerans]|uniref:HAD hydrolase-like protein n=1 Tax=Alicyclobacillus tolerans TaxID=90970 RepID=UPI001F2E4A5D|nr:HAD hydrolase-like protein [Alicyclobacillus tolerans]MCF8564015.1 HAD hydrolase-like protein [Alicyclobacillus tolerans]
MYKSILFDLDGTLTDPQEGIIKSVRYALEQEGFPSHKDADLTFVIGPPLDESFAKLAGTADPAVTRRLVDRYRERFSPIGIFENRLFDEVPSVLEQLVADGAQLYVATSKPTVYAARIVRHFELQDFFTAVVGSELNGERSKKGEVIAHLLNTYDVNPQSAVMVGDRSHDVIGARENNLQAVGVLYGYGSERELTEAKAACLAASPADVLRCLQRLSRS